MDTKCKYMECFAIYRYYALTAYPAYYLFVRGSRAVHLEWATGAPTDPTIIRETGTLNNHTYTKTYTGNAGDYLFVGNPFASSIISIRCFLIQQA